jgi:hypothetical protein
MISYFVIIFLLNFSFIYSFDPNCINCKNYLINKKSPNLSCCKKFKTIIYNKGKEKINYNYAIYCRNDENLCGKSGLLFEEINENEKKKLEPLENELIDRYNELNNRCCGEVNEKYEIEQLERDFFDLFQKMKRYNTNRIYKTSKDLYKLFKRK